MPKLNKKTFTKKISLIQLGTKIGGYTKKKTRITTRK